MKAPRMPVTQARPVRLRTNLTMQVVGRSGPLRRGDHITFAAHRADAPYLMGYTNLFDSGDRLDDHQRIPGLYWPPLGTKHLGDLAGLGRMDGNLHLHG